MFRIGICDDDITYLNKIKLICERWLLENVDEYEIVEFSTGTEVTTYCKEPLQLLFLDIELPGISGIELLPVLSKSPNVWRVVYITNHKELIATAFSIKTIGFLEKPIIEEQILHYMFAVLNEWKSNEIIVFDEKDVKKMIRVEDVVYLKSASNYTEVYCGSEQYSFLVYGTLKFWEKELKKYSFVRVHKSFLVNLFHVEAISENLLTRDQRVIPIGRKNKDEFKKQFEKYCIERMRNRL